MQSEKSQQVASRFFEVINELIELGHLRSLSAFLKNNEIDRLNFYKFQKGTRHFNLEWLIFLVEQYPVSAKYMLTGKGPKFTKKLLKIEYIPEYKKRLKNKQVQPSSTP